MPPIIYCLSQPYDIRLIALAVAVCLVSSVATFSLYPRAITEAAKGNPPLWVALTTIAAGSAVWATHFTAMLAFEPAFPIGFNVWMTVASFAVAMAITGLALFIAVHARHRVGTAIAGIVLGLAISAMHYTGLDGMQVPGHLRWSGPVIFISVALSVVFSVAALFACGLGDTLRRRASGASLFSLAIASLHFTGMAAFTIVPNSAKQLPPGLIGGDLLAFTIGIVALLIVGAAASTWFVDRRVRRESDLRVRFMARHDILTSLPNRLLFQEVAERELAHIGAAQRTAAMLCLDLDGFKEVNDLFGHAAGDAVLVEVGRRLQSLLGERCVAARLGGDEFAVLATGLGQQKTAATAAQSVLDVLGAPYLVDGNKFDVGCSVGVAVFPTDASGFSQLLGHSDIALSRAKASGRGVYRFYEPAMDEALRERRRLGLDLRAALGTDQLRLVFQPQIDLSDEALTGFEALLRWDHPTRGAISPVTFIPIAEETGLILPLGEWVLRESCREASTWQDELTVAVNLSVAQFRQSGFLEMFAQILHETGLPAHRLEVEVTESLFLDTAPRVLRVLEALKAMGIRISMDDFGTGFSSLATLQSFAFDKIKIDRSFTEQIGSEAKGTAIVRAVVSLGQALGMTVIAEGVETAEQVGYLRQQQCQLAQGYLYGKPLPIEHYADLVRAPDAKRVA